MPKSKEFERIYKDFISRYGATEGEKFYYAYLNKHKLDDTKAYPKGKEQKESVVHGYELKEVEGNLHVSGLIATTHRDKYGDVIPVETLQAWANTLNNNERSRVMGIYHSEGKGYYGGKADTDSTPATVIELADGHYGLYTDTVILNNDEIGNQLKSGFSDGSLTHFSVTYTTNGSQTCEFAIDGEEVTRIIGPESTLFGYTATGPHMNEHSDFVSQANDHAIVAEVSYKEFKELTRQKSEQEIGFAQEKDEHPELDDTTIHELVNDHLRKNPKYYSQEKKNITTRAGFDGNSQACNTDAAMAAHAINASGGNRQHPRAEIKNMEAEHMAELDMEIKSKPTLSGEGSGKSSSKGMKGKAMLDDDSENQSDVEEADEDSDEVGSEIHRKGKKKEKKEFEVKELAKSFAEEILREVTSKLEVKEAVLKDSSSQLPGASDVAIEVKDFIEAVVKPDSIELKEQFRRAGAVFDKRGFTLEGARTTPVERREYKNFGTNGTKLEYKGLGITSNQNSTATYLLSAAELQDVFDPVIYNLLNQQTVTWNLLEKDDYSKKGNNQVQFTAKYAKNASVGWYLNNAVSTDRASRLKFMTKFKKLQVGVSVDGDMIAAARGGPVGDVFAQEVYDATIDMLSTLNAQLFLTKGAETDAEIIGFEYIANSATYTSLYGMTRSATTNLLAPTAAGDTYINASSQRPTMVQFRQAIAQAIVEGVRKSNLIWITHPTQGNLLRTKFDDQKMLVEPRATDFGFSTDLFIDGIPVFEDKDCPNSKWFLIDKESHRVAIWVPPTIEKLGITGDSQDAFIKTYLAVYNRRPRALVEIYSCATS